MIEYRVGETAAGRMAQTTILGGGNMVRRFAGGPSAVMAVVTTLAQHVRTGVIHIGRSEIRGVMTHPAILGGHRMRRTGGFTPGSKGCEAAIVTGLTIAGDVRVVKIRRRRKIAGRCSVTIVTILRRGQMILRFNEPGTQEPVLVAPFAPASDVQMHVTQELRG